MSSSGTPCHADPQTASRLTDAVVLQLMEIVRRLDEDRQQQANELREVRQQLQLLQQASTVQLEQEAAVLQWQCPVIILINMWSVSSAVLAQRVAVAARSSSFSSLQSRTAAALLQHYRCFSRKSSMNSAMAAAPRISRLAQQHQVETLGSVLATIRASSSGAAVSPASAALLRMRFRCDDPPSAHAVFSAMLQPRRAASAAASEKSQEEGDKAKEETGDKAKEGDKVPPKQDGFFTSLRKDFVNYPDIYNSINGLHFLLFLLFCLASTSTPDETTFWKAQLAVSDLFRPLAWITHSFITDNFMAMAYSMMMLHKCVVQMISVWGLARTQAFVLITAAGSGAIMWLGNYVYYRMRRTDSKPEVQYGPWDVMYALLFAQYIHVSIHPIRSVLSFDHWLKYASAVGTVCIWYFDWQPVLVGSMLGIILCKTVPAFRCAAAAV
eukprot:gene9493-6663_t